MSRLADINRFYDLLGTLEQKLGGSRTLDQCHGRLPWPKRGVYFFFEPGEERSGSGTGPRIVRVGTHGLTNGSKSSLWKRLSQHRGRSSGTGSHRSSVFRLLVGTALLADGREGPCLSWDQKSAATGSRDTGSADRKALRAAERPVELAVSSHIRGLPFIWLEVDDEPSKESLRGLIERNSIALLSNWTGEAIDAPSPAWLGHKCNRERVQRSGLWNNNHVDESYDSSFLPVLEQLINAMRT